MNDSRLSRPVGLPIGPNGQLIQGRLLLNNNGDAEWFQGSAGTPTFTSNASDNYQWKPSPGGFIIGGQREAFYATPASTTTLNNARLQTWNSPTGYNSPQLAKQLNIPGANVAPTPPQQPGQGGNPSQQPGQGGTPPPAPVLPSPAPVTTEEGVGLKPVNNGRFQYPLNMDAKQDKIKFIACEISRDNLSSTILGFKFPGPTYKKVGTPVYLAIQAPISDQNSVDWGPDSVNAIDSAIFNLSLEAMTANSNDQLADIVKTKTGEIFTKARQSSDILRKFLAGQAASLNNVLARTDGLVLNPNLELLFQGPQLRPFTFQFKMSARNKDEAKEIKNIIKYFKYYMAVRKTDDELFLKSPCVFTIQYLKGEDPHKSINLISPGDEKKACALTNCSVDYTPLGTYMTYNDQSDPESTMVAYTLSLQFQELEPIYNTDYRDFAKDHSIGF